MNERLNGYNFFSSLFFNLPDREFVENLFSQDLSSDAPGVDLIRAYVESVKNKDIDTIVDEIAVDRTQLVHGLTPGRGPRPPYGSLYMKSTEQEQIDNLRGLNALYRAAGFTVNALTHQPSDFIGTQMAFIELLIKQGEATFETQKDFFNKHLNKWGTRYADEIIKFAKTDYWRGIGHLLKSFLEEEAEVYS